MCFNTIDARCKHEDLGEVFMMIMTIN